MVDIGTSPQRGHLATKISNGCWVTLALLLPACSGTTSPNGPPSVDVEVSDEVSEASDVGDIQAESPNADAVADDVETSDATAFEPDIAEAPGDVSASDEVSETSDDAADTLSAPPDVAVSPIWRCQPGDDSGSLDLPEGSGAVRFADGASLVVADSGHRGRAVLLSAAGTPSRVDLPLDGPVHATTGEFTDDDVEGLSLGVDGRLYGLTSAGWLRVWTRDGSRFSLTSASAPLSEDGTFACANRAVNCGPNYEGLCLRPADFPAPTGPAATCVGYAASKARGELVCLIESEAGAPLQVDPGRVFSTGFLPDQLSDCAFVRDADGMSKVLLAGNLLSGSELRLFDETTQTHSLTDVIGAPNQEALLDRGAGLWWSIGDLQHYSPSSPWSAFSCRTSAR